MIFLTVEEILFIHHRLLVELEPDNDDFSVINPGGLVAAIARPQQSVNGADAYPDACSMAAALMESLINAHIFLDGNKRVGITAACIFLLNNGYKTYANDVDVFQAAMSAGAGAWKFQELNIWFEQHFIKEE